MFLNDSNCKNLTILFLIMLGGWIKRLLHDWQIHVSSQCDSTSLFISLVFFSFYYFVKLRLLSIGIDCKTSTHETVFMHLFECQCNLQSSSNLSRISLHPVKIYNVLRESTCQTTKYEITCNCNNAVNKLHQCSFKGRSLSFSLISPVSGDQLHTNYSENVNKYVDCRIDVLTQYYLYMLHAVTVRDYYLHMLLLWLWLTSC